MSKSSLRPWNVGSVLKKRRFFHVSRLFSVLNLLARAGNLQRRKRNDGIARKRRTHRVLSQWKSIPPRDLQRVVCRVREILERAQTISRRQPR